VISQIYSRFLANLE